MMTSNPDQVIRLIISDIRLGTRSTSTSALHPTRDASCETIQATQADASTSMQSDKPRQERLKTWVCLLLLLLIGAGLMYILIFTRDGSIPVYPPGPQTGTSTTTENDYLTQSHAEPDLRTTNSTTLNSHTLTSSRTTTTMPLKKPPPPTRAPFPSHILVCSISELLSRFPPDVKLCGITFVIMRTSLTEMRYAGRAQRTFEALRRQIVASKTKLGIDLHYEKVEDTATHLKRPKVQVSISKMGASLSGVLDAEVGKVWSSRADAIVSVLNGVQKMIHAVRGPVIGVVAEPGTASGDHAVHGTLSRLLRRLP
ncbi:uncharacterized protein LOC135387292 [Ornithodoros turicata]|uniref:uncharacterized protein LOC135387292 n=1 Tax=Ornithodoros turicata TaxID=34597 RepID=UPI003138B697